jgi:hypothetical protein
MKQNYLKATLICFAMILMVTANTMKTFANPLVDTITITVYCDMRDIGKLGPVGGDSTAFNHNVSQLANFDDAEIFLTGDWTPETAAGKGDWTFISMKKAKLTNSSMKDSVYVGTIKYPAGNTKCTNSYCRKDSTAWYFALTNDWSTAEWVPAPCNIMWSIQRAFKVDITHSDTTVVFKYGVCAPQTLSSIVITSISSFKQESVDFFPNPASEVITLKNANGTELVKMFDMTGRLVKQVRLTGKVEETISLTGLPSQMYLLQIYNNNGSIVTSKILKR